VRGARGLAAGARRTTGSTSSSTGNATTQDRPQAVIHCETNCGDSPTPLSVLMNETMQVISTESRKAVTSGAKRAGNLGMPKAMVVVPSGWFMGSP
jgi:hypothetical protein